MVSPKRLWLKAVGQLGSPQKIFSKEISKGHVPMAESTSLHMSEEQSLHGSCELFLRGDLEESGDM
jgi:hypothetical protein